MGFGVLTLFHGTLVLCILELLHVPRSSAHLLELSLFDLNFSVHLKICSFLS